MIQTSNLSGCVSTVGECDKVDGCESGLFPTGHELAGGVARDLQLVWGEVEDSVRVAAQPGTQGGRQGQDTDRPNQ